MPIDNEFYNLPPEVPAGEPIQTDLPRESMRSIVSTVLLFLSAPLMALILIMFVIQSYEVDGQSMQQTLQDNDLLIVNKVPRTLSRITGNDYIPKRGDIVIFSRHGEFVSGSEEGKQLVKRVIGLPGERVVVKDGQVTVFSKEKPSGFNPDANTNYSDTISITQGNVDLTVPEGELFVVGDNRGNSLDSRIFGTVPAEDIIGKLGVRIFPLSKARSF